MLKTSILLMSVGKYDQFINQMIDSIEKHWKHDYHIYLFTDKIHELPYEKVSQLKIPFQKFPYCSLYRYHYFLQYQEYLTGDYIFYVDIDARFVGDVGNEILGDGITAVKHCGYYSRPGYGGWETNTDSFFYLPDVLKHTYFGGGFQGGKAIAWWRMCELLSRQINFDIEKGILPEHNDETAFNYYCNFTLEQKDINILSPEYHYTEDPEKAKLWGIDHLEPKLLLLEKDHKNIR